MWTKTLAVKRSPTCRGTILWNSLALELSSALVCKTFAHSTTGCLLNSNCQVTGTDALVFMLMVTFGCTSCGALWLSGSLRDVQVRDRRFDPQLRWVCSDVVLLGKALCSHVRCLDPGVSGYLVGQWRLVCLNSSVRWKMAARLYAPQGAEMAYEWAGPMTRG